MKSWGERIALAGVLIWLAATAMRDRAYQASEISSTRQAISEMVKIVDIVVGRVQNLEERQIKVDDGGTSLLRFIPGKEEKINTIEFSTPDNMADTICTLSPCEVGSMGLCVDDLGRLNYKGKPMQEEMK